MATAGEWRAAKEAFVTGLEGTTLGELALLGLLPPAGAALSALARRAAGLSYSRAAGAGLLLDFAALPGLFAAVLLRLCSLPAALSACLIGCAALARLPPCPPPRGGAELSGAPLEGHLQCVGEARGGLLLVTAASILAVDFPAFPRRWAKAETFGVGLMDIGVGQFVLHSALASGLSAWRRGGPAGAPLRAAAPLLVLGLGRVAAVRAADYHEHVGEYGVHWNFFLTMAVVAALGNAFHPPPQLCAALGAALLVLHQAALAHGGSEFVMTSERSGGVTILGRLLVLNKEGICSLPGYVALFLLARAGAAALRGAAAGAPPGRLPAGAIGRLAVAAAVLWGAAVLLDGWFEPVSRRSANAAYVALSLAFGLSSLTLHALAGEAAGAPGPAALLEAFNRRGLPAFLLANLLTGAVNMGFDTLHAGASAAAGIVGVYLAVLCLFVRWPASRECG